MRKTYKYIIELSKPVWPRHIVDETGNGKIRDAKLLSVKDLQNDTHIYGDTYYLDRPNVYKNIAA